MFRQLSLIFGSKTKAQEIVLLLRDAKGVVRQGFSEQELYQVKQFCRKNNIFLVRSTYKILFADEGIYSNKGIRISEQDPRPGMYFIYLSKDEQKAWLASYYELQQDHQKLGLMLGYPQCCVEYFSKSFDPQRTNLELSSQNPYTNLSKRGQDVVILSHFPCRSDCQESIRLGERYLQPIRAFDQERARELLTALQVK